jgi:DNA-directed RNA polymerase subunit L
MSWASMLLKVPIEVKSVEFSQYHMPHPLAVHIECLAKATHPHFHPVQELENIKQAQEAHEQQHF